MRPNILTLDIETSLMEVYSFAIKDQYIAPDQIKKDWEIISFAAKWLHEPKAIQMDQSNHKEISLIKALWKLLNEADIIITQYGKRFDIPAIHAKFLEYKMKKPASFQQIDTKMLASKTFKLPSYSLEYMSEKFNARYKKLKHGKFPGKALWIECSKGNLKAWKEMATYNVHDVLATEELYKNLAPWGTGINFNIYEDSPSMRCSCGSTSYKRNGFFYSSTGKFQRYSCKKCGAEARDRKSVLSKAKKASLKSEVKKY